MIPLCRVLAGPSPYANHQWVFATLVYANPAYAALVYQHHAHSARLSTALGSDQSDSAQYLPQTIHHDTYRCRSQRDQCKPADAPNLGSNTMAVNPAGDSIQQKYC